MSAAVCRILLAFLVTSGSVLGANSATQPDAALGQWVDQLGAMNRADGDAAEAHLIDAGKSAIGILRAAENDPRPEVRVRAVRALRTIQLFRLRGVNDDALSLAQRYLALHDFGHRRLVLNSLFALQPPPIVVLTRLYTLENDRELRRQILDWLVAIRSNGTGYRDAIPGMLVDDDLPGALMVLNALCQSDDSDGIADIPLLVGVRWNSIRSAAADAAMLLLLSGQIDQQIEICSVEQINGNANDADRAAVQLCYMYRVLGKSDQALRYARLSHDQALILLVLQDQRDWSAAAKEPDVPGRDPLTTAAYRAMFQRLSGHPVEAASTMASVTPVEDRIRIILSAGCCCRMTCPIGESICWRNITRDGI